MSLLTFAQWVQSTGWATGIRGSWYVYPVILSLHMCAIAFFGAMILTTDLRLLGVVMRKRPVAEVVNQLRIPKRIGFLLVATCGLLLASSKAEEYYYNPFFWTKMSLLALVCVHALVFRPRVYNKAAELDAAPRIPGRAKLAAVLSLVLWTCIFCAGRGIGYVEPPLDKLHASLEGRRNVEVRGPRGARTAPAVGARGVRALAAAPAPGLRKELE